MIADDEEERNLRRVSYLRATKEDRMHVDSDNEEHEHAHPSTPKHRYDEEIVIIFIVVSSIFIADMQLFASSM